MSERRAVRPRRRLPVHVGRGGGSGVGDVFCPERSQRTDEFQPWSFTQKH